MSALAKQTFAFLANFKSATMVSPMTEKWELGDA
jgi:hypothetical protein